MFGRRTYFLAAVQIVSAAIFLSLPATAQGPKASYHYVSNTRPPDAFLSLRNEPSIHAGKRIATMPNGTLLQVIRRQDDGWWFVRVVESGQEGWALSAQADRRWIECCRSSAGGAPSARTEVAEAPATTVLAQAGGGVGYEPALRTLAGRLVAQLETAGQKSGTVLDFTDLQGHGTELGRFLAQELSDQVIAAAKTLTLVDRANLQHLLRENKLSMEGLVNPETSRKLGNMIGIDTVIFGTVTPIGKSIRLSVRAVAVETGRIVASQSTTLPAIGEFGELYTRGVTASSSDAVSQETASTRSKLRDRLRADSLRFSVNELAVAPDDAYQPGVAWSPAQITFQFQNLSGVGLGVGVQDLGYAAGPCTPTRERGNKVSGLPSIDRASYDRLIKQPQLGKHLQWVPTGGKVSATISLNQYDCTLARVAGLKTVPVTVTFVVVSGDEVLIVPMSTDKVPIRIMQNRRQ